MKYRLKYIIFTLTLSILLVYKSPGIEKFYIHSDALEMSEWHPKNVVSQKKVQRNFCVSENSHSLSLRAYEDFLIHKNPDEKKPLFKPMVKMILSQSSFSFIANILNCCGLHKILSRNIFSNIHFSFLNSSSFVHKFYYIISVSILPLDFQKSIIDSNIIMC